ncbi:MAG: polyamine aminopropyltransferase [Bdellovibrionales bacterium]|nr:polyamine aminopropyltransferase [Bdellovibrionales bacterium]
MTFALLLSVAVIATCGLVYELIAGALASYLLGDSITQFSTVIGAYLFAMGIGSYLSKYFKKNLLLHFIQIEILVGLVGGFSATVLFLSFEWVSSFRVLLYSLVTLTGILVGLEIPLLMRILKEKFDFSDLISRVFAIDYAGALLASLIFPLVLVPQLGLVRSGYLFGILNVSVGLWVLFLFSDMKWARTMKFTAVASLVALVLGFMYSEKIVNYAEVQAYQETVIYSKRTQYQKVVLTYGQDDLRMFLNGNLQFSSRDEYRYHEALVHMGLANLPQAQSVLVLGGGDGLAVREILKYPNVERVTLVDLDPYVTKLFREHELLRELNEDALNSEKVEVINSDAFIWIKQAKKKYDFVVIDFPDPSNYSLGKLYTTRFFRQLDRVMKPQSVLAIQSTSPYFARRSYWCVNSTLQSVGFNTLPYHANVPSFGEWGYFLASKGQLSVPEQFPEGLKFIGPGVAKHLTVFPEDMSPVETEVNRLNNQILVRYFEDEWSKVN